MSFLIGFWVGWNMMTAVDVAIARLLINDAYARMDRKNLDRDLATWRESRYRRWILFPGGAIVLYLLWWLADGRRPQLMSLQ